jgi:hypothetical protein
MKYLRAWLCRGFDPNRFFSFWRAALIRAEIERLKKRIP